MLATYFILVRIVVPIYVLMIALYLAYRKWWVSPEPKVGINYPPPRSSAVRAAVTGPHLEPIAPLLPPMQRTAPCHNPWRLEPEPVRPARPQGKAKRKPKKKTPLAVTQLRSPKRRKRNARRRKSKTKRH